MNSYAVGRSAQCPPPRTKTILVGAGIRACPSFLCLPFSQLYLFPLPPNPNTHQNCGQPDAEKQWKYAKTPAAIFVCEILSYFLTAWEDTNRAYRLYRAPEVSCKVIIWVGRVKLTCNLPFSKRFRQLARVVKFLSLPLVPL